MTDEKQPEKKYGATPGRLALIGVLAIVFLFVVYRNFFSGSSESAPSVHGDVAVGEEDSRLPSGTKNNGAKRGPNTVDRLAARLLSRPWPNFPLAEAAEYDPFALPSAFPQPEETIVEETGLPQTPDAAAAALAAKQAELAATQAATLAAIRQQGVQVIFKNADEFVAVIGDREVRVGDEVAGLIVEVIGTDGVTLKGMEAK